MEQKAVGYLLAFPGVAYVNQLIGSETPEYFETQEAAEEELNKKHFSGKSKAEGGWIVVKCIMTFTPVT